MTHQRPEWCLEVDYDTACLLAAGEIGAREDLVRSLGSFAKYYDSSARVRMPLRGSGFMLVFKRKHARDRAHIRILSTIIHASGYPARVNPIDN